MNDSYEWKSIAEDTQVLYYQKSDGVVVAHMIIHPRAYVVVDFLQTDRFSASSRRYTSEEYARAAVERRFAV